MSKTRNLSDLLDANGDVKATALDNTALSTISGDSDDITEGSTNLFLTTSERTKLSGIEASATADQTDAEIKTAYENNSDTNAFTDAEQTKLSGIETGATADQTASEILTAIKTVDGSGSGLDADLLDGNEASAFATSAQGSTADSALQNVSEDTTPQLGGDLDANGKNIKLGDFSNAPTANQLSFGASDDFKFNYNGSLNIASIISGGDLRLESGSTGSQSVTIETSSETMAEFKPNSSVDLYYDNSKKFETTSSGVDITGTLQTSSNAIIGGDLTVSGTTTTVNTETINLADNNIVLNSNHTGTPTQNAGITIERGTSTDKVFQWNESSDYWETDDNFNVTGNITVSGTVDGRDIAADGTTLDAVASTYVNVSGDTLTGDLEFGDNIKANFGDNDELNIYHGSTIGNIIDSNTNTLSLVVDTGSNVDVMNGQFNPNYKSGATFDPDGAQVLKYDSAQKFATTSTGIDVTGTVTFDGGTTSADLAFGDNVKAVFGDGSDLQIEHNGTNTKLTNQTGTLKIVQNVNDGDVEISSDDGSGSTALYFVADGSSGEAILYHYGSEKLATKSTGIDVTGTVTADGLTVDTDTLYVDATNNRVGIGTTSPSYQLHIGGTTDNTVAQFKSTDDTSQILISDDDTNGYLGVRNDFIYISPTSSTGADGLVVRTDTGNVGIGTASPTQALDVNGSIASDISINAQTGTTYTTVLADRSKLVTLDNASAVTVTIPPNSSVAYPTGTKIDLLAKGAGQVTVAEGSGVTVNSSQSLKLRAQWSAASVIKLATDTWVLVGDLQAV